MAIKKLKLEFKTAEEQVRYFIQRDVQMVSFSLFQPMIYDGTLEIEYPSQQAMIKEFFLEERTYSVLQDYENIEFQDVKPKEQWHLFVQKLNEYLQEQDFLDYVEDRSEYSDWKDDFYREWYPVGANLYNIPNYYMSSEGLTVDKLYELGFGVITFDGEYYLFIVGGGYDFIQEHFIPMYEEMGWITEEERSEADQLIEELCGVLDKYKVNIILDSAYSIQGSEGSVYNKLLIFRRSENVELPIAYIDLGSQQVKGCSAFKSKVYAK